MEKGITFFRIAVLCLGLGLFVACGSDDAPTTPVDTIDPDPAPTGEEKSFELGSFTESLVGIVTFIEIDDNSVTVDIEINNSTAGVMHPVHLHEGTAIENGGIARSLNPVDGDTGKSSTNFNQLDDGTAITYAQMLAFDGYLNVHNSMDDLQTIIAQGDIGQNELTGAITTYALNSVAVPEISGTAFFAERVNGEALSILSLDNTPAGGMHPAHIHMNSAAEGGDIVLSFNPVDGDFGTSGTNISMLDDGSPFGYDELIAYDGYINVHLSAEDLGTLVAQGNIGSNADIDPSATTNYDITNEGASAYIFNGNGLSDMSNPNITLKRGETYTFSVNAPGHPFLINSVQGVGTANTYNEGVTNNGAAEGTVTFTVPADAPDTLFYNCEFHASMTGELNIIN